MGRRLTGEEAGTLRLMLAMAIQSQQGLLDAYRGTEGFEQAVQDERDRLARFRALKAKVDTTPVHWGDD